MHHAPTRYSDFDLGDLLALERRHMARVLDLTVETLDRHPYWMERPYLGEDGRSYWTVRWSRGAPVGVETYRVGFDTFTDIPAFISESD